MTRTRKGEEYVKQVFGGSLYQQGRGFYVALELIAILRGSVMLEAMERRDSEASAAPQRVLPDPNERVAFLRPTQDFARRLMANWFEENDLDARSEHMNAETAGTLRSLLIGLHAPVPGRRKTPAKWRKWHLYPYPPDFIHYDALQRQSKISIERDSFRGGGGLAHKILRTDDNAERLERTRELFRELLSDSNSPLAEIARALGRLEAATQGRETEWKDETEFESRVLDSPWTEQLREGVHNILANESVPEFKKFEALMHWVPFCIMRHQHALAHLVLDSNSHTRTVLPLVFDCQPDNNPVRNRAREDFQHCTAAIGEALRKAVEDDADVEEDVRDRLLEGSSNWLSGPRTFFTTTSFAVGASNAPAGTRWFTLAPELLETIVLACVKQPVPFDVFCEGVLYERLGIVTGVAGATSEELVDEINTSNFESNEHYLADTLYDLGLLQRFSDMTQMVGVTS